MDDALRLQILLAIASVDKAKLLIDEKSEGWKEGLYEYADMGVDIGCLSDAQICAVLHGIATALSSSTVRHLKKTGINIGIIGYQ